MKLLGKRTRTEIIIIWLLIILASFYVYFFQKDLILTIIDKFRLLPAFWLYSIYLIVGCLRGFTLIPVTYLILLGLIFLPALPSFILTMIGVMVSSACIYYFSDYLNLGNYFKNKHPEAIEKLKSVLSKNELPIVISWGFLPFLPTDLLCYVCGTLEINIKKFLIGLFIGEGVACAIYIFFGKDLLLFLAHKALGM